MRLQKKLACLSFLLLSSCASVEESWEPKVFILEGGLLTNGKDKVQCDSKVAETLLCISKFDYVHIVEECSEAKRKPWYKKIFE